MKTILAWAMLFTAVLCTGGLIITAFNPMYSGMVMLAWMGATAWAWSCLVYLTKE